ncbi:MAG TPA: SPOR domain-containing protein [Pyrinomonadaceae bacterium]|nr:SPOR domain-containing protein [Pyrinomonadaceae bacterium]
MKAICPQCNLEDEVDPASVTSETRFVCARCSTSYEVAQDEALAPSLSLSETDAVLEMTALQNEEMVHCPPEIQQDDLLILPEQPSSSHVDDGMVVLPELFIASPAEQKEAQREEPVAPVEPPKAEEQSAGLLLNSQSPDITVAPEERSEAANTTVTGAPPDLYAEGVRLMRVSPSRLFMGGVAFIFLIVVCNLMVAPVMRTGKASGSVIAKLSQENNHSANQAAHPPVARAESEQVKPATHVEEVQPTPTPTPAPTPQPHIVVEPAPEATPAPSLAQPSQAAQDGRFTVQVGSYNERGQAEERAAKLRAAGFDARVVEAQIPNRGIWYRVQAGRFATSNDATRYGAEIRAKGAADAAVVTAVQ